MNTDFLPVCPLGDDHAVDGFDSGVEEIDRWLRRMARTAGLLGTAATYVLVRAEPDRTADRPSPDRPDGGPDGEADVADRHEVVGFYCLAVRSIEQDLGPRLLGRGMPESVSVIHIARLAVARDAQGVGLGGELLVEAIRRAVAAAENVGARAVVVDAVDESAFRFYEHFGFEDLEGMRLFKSVADLDAALRALDDATAD